MISNAVSVVLFRLLFFLIFAGLQFLLYRRTVRWLQRGSEHRLIAIWATRVLFLWFNLPAIVGFIMRPDISSFRPLFMYSYLYPFFVWHGATFLLGLIVVLGIIIRTPFRSLWWFARKIDPGTTRKIGATPAVQRFDRSRRVFLRKGMVGVTAASFGGAAYGIAFESTHYDVITREIPIPSLHPSLDGFEIALISDTHSGPFMSRGAMEKVARMTNALRPDLTLVTGDFVNSRLQEVYPFAEAFSSLTARHGVYGVLGNHDFYTGQVEAVAREVERCGITLLRDREITIRQGDASISLAGIDDAGTLTAARARIARAYEKGQDAPRILMCHRPYYLMAAHEQNVALMLSGHTHGGQVVLGRFGETTIAPAAIASSYVWGEYVLESTRLYVNRGIGTVGLPIRLNCPPEITRIILRRSPSGPIGPT